MEPDVDVAVIGAGAAGLSAAKALHARGLRVAVLEAGSKVGGRVLADQSLAGAPRELGPEFIHGEHSNQLVELIEAGLAARPAARLVELDWPNYFYLGKEGRLVSAAQAQAMPEVAAMETAFEALGGTEAEAVPEQSLLQYLVAAGVESRVLDLADAIYANDYGAVASDVGLRETIHEQRSWTYGEKYLVLSGACLQDAMDQLSDGLDVRCGWTVTSVALPPHGGVLLLSADGRRLSARRAVLSVPLALLQRGTIDFEPPLPPEHVKAIGAVKIGNALKVLLLLSHRFWPGDFYDAVCADATFPEVWLTPAAEAMGPHAEPPFTLVGFVSGARADRLATLSHPELARLLCAQLDAMFGTVGRPHPASQACTAHLVKDWAQAPHARGAYSYPTPSALGARRQLSAPVGGRLFFCGEACHEGINPCIHGAMETGRRAAEEAAASLQQGEREAPMEPAEGARSRL